MVEDGKRAGDLEAAAMHMHVSFMTRHQAAVVSVQSKGALHCPWSPVSPGIANILSRFPLSSSPVRTNALAPRQLQMVSQQIAAAGYVGNQSQDLRPNRLSPARWCADAATKWNESWNAVYLTPLFPPDVSQRTITVLLGDESGSHPEDLTTLS